ncbi:MAG: hypothetical protein JRG91_11865 [Deltaproteobacteria bacterium]|nr:hypothetical protein [Deltaproteobacteria bacterium]
MGYPGGDAYVEALVTGGLTDSVFVDSTEPTESCIAAYSARTYDVFIIDRTGRLAGHFNVGTNTLYEEENRTLLYFLVLGILGYF